MGTRLEIPLLTSAERDEVERILARFDEEKREAVKKAFYEFGGDVLEEVVDNPKITGHEASLESYSSKLQDSGQDAFSLFATTQLQSAQNQAQNETLFVGVQAVEQNLEDFFMRLQEEQAYADEIRTDIAELESAIEDWPDDGSVQVFDYHQSTINPDGSVTVVERNNVALTKDEAEQLLGELRYSADSLGEVANRNNMWLQKIVQDYQRALTTASNIMNLQHDTHRAIVNNVRA